MTIILWNCSNENKLKIRDTYYTKQMWARLIWIFKWGIEKKKLGAKLNKNKNFLSKKLNKNKISKRQQRSLHYQQISATS